MSGSRTRGRLSGTTAKSPPPTAWAQGAARVRNQRDGSRRQVEEEAALLVGRREEGSIAVTPM
uniref:Uncharacterized protein n=1 Tax=Oryza nivara TaxID=4536 RepID=A0A0E0HC22_ORYNI